MYEIKQESHCNDQFDDCFLRKNTKLYVQGITRGYFCSGFVFCACQVVLKLSFFFSDNKNSSSSTTRNIICCDRRGVLSNTWWNIGYVSSVCKMYNAPNNGSFSMPIHVVRRDAMAYNWKYQFSYDHWSHATWAWLVLRWETTAQCRC